MSTRRLALPTFDIADGCTNVRVEDGIEVPCGRPAVGLRIDPEFREYGPYPVCVGHVRHPMVPLADFLAAHDAEVRAEAWDEGVLATAQDAIPRRAISETRARNPYRRATLAPQPAGFAVQAPTGAPNYTGVSNRPGAPLTAPETGEGA